MDLQLIATNVDINREPPFSKPALYIIKPDGLQQRWNDAYRCGVAGSKAFQTAVEEGAELDLQYGSTGSSLFTRCRMYFNSWIAGGRLMAALTIPAAFSKGFSYRALGERAEGDNREDYARPGVAAPRAREMEYHAKLDANRQVRRLRSDRAEWFAGPIRQIKKELMAVGGEYFEFDDGATQIPEPVKLLRTREDDLTKIANRTSPRLRLTEEEIDALREPTEKTPDVLQRMVRALVPLRRSRRLSEKELAANAQQLRRSARIAAIAAAA